MRAILLAVIALLYFSSPVEAQWAERLWGEEKVVRDGNPSITLHRDLGVSMTLPSRALADALAEGMNPTQAVTAFLARHGPGMCSEVIDLNKPHAKLHVRLRLQDEIPVTDPRVKRAFEVDDVPIEFEINHVPARVAKCVDPSAYTS